MLANVFEFWNEHGLWVRWIAVKQPFDAGKNDQ